MWRMKKDKDKLEENGDFKERGRKRDQNRLYKSRASNKFGHRKEMELFTIDNAAPYQ